MTGRGTFDFLGAALTNVHITMRASRHGKTLRQIIACFPLRYHNAAIAFSSTIFFESKYVCATLLTTLRSWPGCPSSQCESTFTPVHVVPRFVALRSPCAILAAAVLKAISTCFKAAHGDSNTPPPQVIPHIPRSAPKSCHEPNQWQSMGRASLRWGEAALFG
jgi:hypothetical protein